ncbi:MAG: outer membrane lipid asymmetry maintenance protein MlaD [Pseudomonadota bacterium]|nr:outer membrane lipid asymmetry maintenance protein MlaD [Pseudomonadota bacterium]
MNRSAIDLWVGIFVAIGFGAILFLALKVGNLVTLDSTPGYHLDASFDNIGGLKLRAPVKAAGVVVGRVEKVRLDTKTYDAVVTLRIDHQYEFTKDTIASINTSGLLGEVYIGLDAGGDPVMLKDGDRIFKTQSAVVIEKLISQFLFDKASGGGGGAATPVNTVEKPAGETRK